MSRPSSCAPCRQTASTCCRSSTTCSTSAGSSPGRSNSISSRSAAGSWPRRSCWACDRSPSRRGSTWAWVAPEDDLEVRSDRRSLSQILINLTNNAIKFTDEGGVRLEVSRQSENGASAIRFSVVDTGRGIRSQGPAEAVRRVRADPGLFRARHEGTGLGLYICQRLAVLIGGVITFESELGEGSTFTLELRGLGTYGDGGTHSRGRGQRGQHEPDGLPPQGHGYEPLEAVDGAEGVRVATEARPDLILLDLRMPEMDGYQAVDLIRDWPRLEKTRVVAVTASAMVGDRERIAAAGFDGYIRKPIVPRDVRGRNRAVPARGVASRPGGDGGAAVTSILAARRPPGQSRPAVDGARLRRLHGARGLDGQTALDLARSERPDLIIADIVMPEMNGYEFVRELRSDPVVGNTPVIFCTATYAEGETRQLADACGVSHFLVKPCEPETIVRVVGEALGSSARADGDAGFRSAVRPPDAASPEREAGGEGQGTGSGERRAGTACARERTDPELGRRRDLPGGSRGPDHLREPGGRRPPRLPRRGPARARRPRARAPLPSRPDPVPDRRVPDQGQPSRRGPSRHR